MIQSKKLLTDLKKQVTLLENDLRQRCKDHQDEIDAPLRAQYDAAKAGKRTAMTYGAWLDEQLTQVAVAWVLACVFVRFLEDNGLVEVPKLAGPGALGLRARDEHELFFQKHPTLTEREYLEGVFTETGTLPAMREFFDRRHNPLWQCGPSGDAAAALLDFWRRTDPDSGLLVHDFTDPEWNTRFLGDLYQDLSEAARKKYALLQTPEFIEEFILDRTLGPAIDTFGYQVVRMIDPTCGSGHFLLGGFFRMFRLWQAENPGENPRVLAQNALNAIHGVDLNPYAVAIARFRLLLAALQVCGITKLKNAPDFTIHLASGDSLLHGARFDNEGNPYVEARQELFGGDSKEFKDELKHHYEVEDTEILHDILGQQYHAVVGNPPYITVKDRALSELYRVRFPSCHGKYALSVPFMERFFDLAIKGDGTAHVPAGFTGQITSNSFMKREFGKKLVEGYLPRWDLTHVLDTSGAYIPGHGTPTVILYGKNQPPTNGTIRTVLGIRGEPSTPADPALGFVWQAILKQINEPGSTSEWMSAADSPRANFHQHPWSIGGGGAAELNEVIEAAGDTTLGKVVDQLRGKPNIGITAFTLEDDIYVQPELVLRRHGLPTDCRRVMVEGDTIREWQIGENDSVVWPYTETFAPMIYDAKQPAIRFLWLARTGLARNVMFGRQTKVETGLAWYEFGRLTAHKLRTQLSITFGEITTHNHFVLDRGGKVFKQTAPVIKLKADATESDHVLLLGVLNSSTACFWLRQVCFPKGGDHQGSEGARVRTTLWDERFAFNATQIANLPIPACQPSQLPTALVKTSTALQAQSPASTLASWTGPERGELRTRLATARDQATRLRRQLIAWQEELDWQIYEAYGLIEATDGISLPEGEATDAIPPEGIELGERAFEIVLARRMAAGDVQTAWFTRHSSKPIIELPSHWPSAYRELVERRIRRIMSDSNIKLIEQPEYKRRWNTEIWNSQFQRAATEWLLARLESYFHEAGRVSERKDGFDPAAHGFTASSRPHLVSAQQLAEVVQADPLFLEVAECLEGNSGFSVSALVQRLVEAESVPALARDRYKDSGLRKREDWEETWRLQRVEDEIDAEAARLDAEIEAQIVRVVNLAQPDLVGRLESCANNLDAADQNFHRRFFPDDPYDPKKPHYKRTITDIPPAQIPEWFRFEPLLDTWSEVDQTMKFARREAALDNEVVRLRELKDQLPPKPDIAVPPKYGSGDFKKASYWKLRGKLDVPKERWISYPGAERDGDTSPVIAWAGWDHLDQAKALAEYFLDAKDAHGWPPAKLKPLLAALADLLPWLKQWHNTFDPNYGMGLGDYFQGFLEEQCRALEMTVQEVDAVRFEAAEASARPPARKQAKKRGRKGAEDGGELPLAAASGHWQDQVFALLAPKRKKLSDYRMLVWPELLRQMPGDLEFETFRKAYWLLSEPAELERIGCEVFPDVPVSWWRSRSEQLAKEDFLGTLKGSIPMGWIKIWKENGTRMIRWTGEDLDRPYLEPLDDARIALQVATLWTEEEPDVVRQSIEDELMLLETK